MEKGPVEKNTDKPILLTILAISFIGGGLCEGVYNLATRDLSNPVNCLIPAGVIVGGIAMCKLMMNETDRNQ